MDHPRTFRRRAGYPVDRNMGFDQRGIEYAIPRWVLIMQVLASSTLCQKLKDAPQNIEKNLHTFTYLRIINIQNNK